MNKKAEQEKAVRFVSVKGLQNYCSVGKTTAEKIGKESGALIKIGRRCVYDLTKIDSYMEQLAS